MKPELAAAAGERAPIPPQGERADETAQLAEIARQALVTGLVRVNYADFVEDGLGMVYWLEAGPVNAIDISETAALAALAAAKERKPAKRASPG